MPNSTPIKKFAAVSVLAIIFIVIGLLFWYNEWKFSLPTPIPAAYHSVKIGEHINLPADFNKKNNGPVFLHFFNPDCPCSKFNVPHFNALAKAFGSQIDFAVVVFTKDKTYTADAIREKFGITTSILFDTSLAAKCGVYSTPQAVLIDNNQRLYYRGNYNRNRYCADEKSNYARMAIDSLLSNKHQPDFNPFALTAYGCPLPGCTKN